MKRYLLLPLIIVTYVQVFAQTYFCDNRGRIGVLSIEDCSAEYVRPSSIQPPIDFGPTLNDIALHPDGRLFGVIGSAQEGLLIEISLIEGTIIDTLASIPFDGGSSLVCSREGVLYTGIRRLHSFDMATSTFTTYGAFPNLRRLLGDLIFIDNVLYGSLGDIVFDKGYIYELQPDQIEMSEVKIEFPLGKGVAGLAWCIESEENGLGFKLLGTHQKSIEGVTDIYSLNLDEGTIDSICQIVLPSGELIYGLTSSDEFRQNHRLRLDLDANNDSGRLIDHYFIDSFCVVNFPIGDQDLRITTSYELIDSLLVSVEQGVLAIGEEVLFGEPNPDLELRGVGTDRLLVINQGGLSIAEIEDFLRTVRFQIQADVPLSGDRVVHTTLYAGGTASDVAKSFIQVTIGQPPSAGQDAYVEVCHGPFRVDLFERIGGDPRAGGWWEPALQGGDRFYALEDTSGIYNYIVQEGGCGADTAAVEVFVHQPPPIGLGEEDELISFVEKCPGDTLFWDISIPNGFAYWWRDGQEGPIATIVEPGIYAGEVIDSTNSCFWYVKTVVQEFDPITETETVNLCQGQSWSWQGQLFYRDTILCQAMQDVNGCVGQRCFDIRFAAPEQHWETLYFCQDEQPTIEGVEIQRDTNFCLPPGGSGCGVQSCYIALFKPLAQGHRRIEICQGESYLFNGELLTTSGVYSGILMAMDGCDSLATLELIVHPTYESNIDTLITEGTRVQLGDMSFAKTGNYTIALPSSNGCDSLIQLNLLVQATEYFAPGLVQPKGSGWGEVFTIYSRNQLPATIRKLEIFNTWGQRVFQQENSPVGDESRAWKAAFDSGSPQAAAVYFYHAEVEDITGRRELLRGKFVLMY